MAAGILRSHKPPGLMLPIPQTDIERYVMPFARNVTPPEQGSPHLAQLNHTVHTLATIARFTAAYGGAYNVLLADQLAGIPKMQLEAREELQAGDPALLANYAVTHVEEHLAEALDQGTKTGDRGLVRLLSGNGVVEMFNSVDEQRKALGIPDERISGFLEQRDGFLAAANVV